MEAAEPAPPAPPGDPDAEVKAAFEASSRQLLRIDAGAGIENIELVRIAPIETGEEENILAFTSTTGDPMMTLPAFDLPEGFRPVMKVDLTAPERSVLQLYYRLEPGAAFSEANSVRRTVEEGRNTVYLALPAETAGSLRFDPMKVLGRFEIHELDIRAVEVDAIS